MNPENNSHAGGWLGTAVSAVWNGLNRYVSPTQPADSAAVPVTTDKPAEVFRLKDRPREFPTVNEHAAGGMGAGDSVVAPWNNLPSHYTAGEPMEANSLEEVARALGESGKPLLPGDAVRFGGDLFVYEPSTYMHSVAGASAPTLWHNLTTSLVMPVAVSGGTLVAVSAVKLLRQEQPKTVIEINHGR